MLCFELINVCKWCVVKFGVLVKIMCNGCVIEIFID